MVLDERLESGSEAICEFELCWVRLMRDGENPWFLLIPKRENLKDWDELTKEDRYKLTDEIDFICKVIKTTLKPDKINIASLGNIVNQLHIHIIARFHDDRAWPGPIWGTSPQKEFGGHEVQKWKSIIKKIHTFEALK